MELWSLRREVMVLTVGGSGEGCHGEVSPEMLRREVVSNTQDIF